MKLSLKLGMLSSTNICIAFIFQWYVLAQLGPGLETDAFIAGMTVPQLAVAIICGSLVHVLVPIFAGENKDRLQQDIWGILAIVGGVFGVLFVFLYISATWWVSLTVFGFSDAGKLLTIVLTRIQLIGMFFAAINGIQWATYHARQQFVWAGLSPIISGIISLLLLIWLMPRFGVIAAAWISALRMGIQTLLLAPCLGRPVRPNLRSISIRKAWQRIKPLLKGASYYKTDPLVDRFLLSMVGSGSLTLYYLAQQIYAAISQVLNKAISVPLVPLLSRLYKAGEMENFQRVYYRKLFIVITISIAGLLILGILGQRILALFATYGKISSSDIGELWWIMLCLGGMFAGGVVGQISSSSFFALGDTITPTRIGIYSYTFYIPVKLISFYFFGVFGLAFATSMFFVINFFFQNHYLKKMHF